MPFYTRPPRTMQSSTADLVGRLAAQALLYHELHARCERIHTAVITLRRSGVWAVSGEQELLNDLQELLRLSERIFQSEEPDLKRLNELLSNAVWEVAIDVEADLTDKVMQDKKMGEKYAEKLADRREYVAQLLAELSDARSVQAAVRQEEATIRQLDSMVTQVDRLLRERNYVEAERRFRDLEQKRQLNKELATEIRKRADEAKKFSKTAELMLLQVPDGPDRLRYTVLLRTPSEPGALGVNIESSSCLSNADRARLRRALEAVTTNVNLGLSRSFEQTTRQFSAESKERATKTVVTLRELLRSVGDLLYRLIIPEQIHQFLSEECSLVVTTNDLELPWELMQVNGSALSVRQPIARMPLGRALPRRSRPRNIGGKLKFLLIHADPEGNLHEACKEVKKIKQALDERGNQIAVEILDPEEASGEKLNDVLRNGEYDVIHYAGHAKFEEKDGDLSGLFLHEKEVFFAQKIRRLVEGRPLVFLNACESGRTANERSAQQVEKYLQIPAEGLASAFIYGGAAACVGSVWPVFDGPAAEFAIAFYNAVLDGYQLGDAMRKARLESLQDYPNQITWATYMLYGDPRYRLVD